MLQTIRNSKNKNIKRSCAVCGEKLNITVFPDYTYTGGEYFGKITINQKEEEYWECISCYE